MKQLKNVSHETMRETRGKQIGRMRGKTTDRLKMTQSSSNDELLLTKRDTGAHHMESK